MTKSVAGAIVAVVSIAAIGFIYSSNKPADEVHDSAAMNGMDMPASENMSDNPQQQPDSSEVLSGTVEIDIKKFAYQKESIMVKKGTIVKWTNQDSAKHDVTPDNENEEFRGSGKLLAQGESYSFTFNTVGKFSYFCSPHPYMKAFIGVVE